MENPEDRDNELPSYIDYANVRMRFGGQHIELPADIRSIGEAVCDAATYVPYMRDLDDEDESNIGQPHASPKHLDEAKNLAAQKDTNGHSKREFHYKMIKLLTNGRGDFLFPNDQQATRLLATAYMELGRHKEFFALCWECMDFLLSDNNLLQKYFVMTHKYRGYEDFISIFQRSLQGSTLLLKQNINFLFRYFHYEHDHKTVAAMGDLLAESHLMQLSTLRSFYARALNGMGRTEETVSLFVVQGSDPVTMNNDYCRSVECVKALAYALRSLGREREAKGIIEQAIQTGEVSRDSLEKIATKVGVEGDGARKGARRIDGFWG